MSRRDSESGVPDPDEKRAGSSAPNPTGLLKLLAESAGQLAGAAAKVAKDVRRRGEEVLDKAVRIAAPGVAAARMAAASAADKVDPAAVGGAVAGMSAGEVIGGTIGGVLGSAAGPGGAVLGAELGAFAGVSVGAKLGYDATHELVNPDDADPDTSLAHRVGGVAKTLAKRTGDALGGGIGAAGGGVVGAAVAGPLGGRVGAFVGEALAGDVGERQAAELCGEIERRGHGEAPGACGEELGEPSGAVAAPSDDAGADRVSAGEPERPSPRRWLEGVARDTAVETGLSAVLGTVGSLAAGPLGGKIGSRAGSVAARRMDQSAADPAGSKAAKTRNTRKPKPRV